MKIYVGAYGINVNKIENNKLIDVKNHKIKEKLKEYFKKEGIGEKDIEEAVDTALSMELVNSLFDESYEEFILAGPPEGVVLKPSDKKLDLNRLVKFLGKKVEFIDTDELLKELTTDADVVDIKNSTVELYDRCIKINKPTAGKRLKYVISTSNGIRIVTEMLEQAIKLRCLLDRDCSYELKYVFLNMNDPKGKSLKLTNRNEENKELELVDQLKSFLLYYSKIELNDNRVSEKTFYNLLNDFYYSVQTANIYGVEKLIPQIIEAGEKIDTESNSMISLVNKETVKHFSNFVGNNNKFDYKSFIDNVIEAEHYQLSITMCEGYLRNSICKMVGVKTMNQNNYSIEEECLGWLRKSNKLKIFIEDYDKKPNEKKIVKESISKETAQAVQKKIIDNKLKIKDFNTNYIKFKEFRNNLNHGTTDKTREEQEFKDVLEYGYKCIKCVEELL